MDPAVVQQDADAIDADAIVVLTGGPRRIDVGLDLLSQGRAKRMLISGVDPVTSSAALENVSSGLSATERARLFSCCIDLGRAARDTVGNALEARGWIREGGYSDVLVVTADFHMQRSMLEFERALEGAGPVKLTAWPVKTPALHAEDWYHEPANLRRMAGEWIKYLSAQSKGWFGSEFLKRWFPAV